MQKQTSIYIPKPCHEDWNKMTPTQQGKFCSACNKQVVDFSLMSDNQVLNFLSNQSGKLCGRFDAEQLQRPLVETKVQKKKSWWMALTMPLLFLFDKSDAQSRNIVGDTIYNANSNEASICKPNVELTQILGKITSTSEMIIKGKVVDENNNSVPFATITEKGFKHAVAADAEGNYSISLNRNMTGFILNAYAVGYESIDKIIYSENDSNNFVMKKDTSDLRGVVVTVAGGISACRRVKTIDTLHATAKKIFGTAMFKIYPNPVVNNSIINLQIKNTGSYQMQLLDNQSRLIQTEEINVDAKNTTTQIQLQSNIAAGMYYLRLINEQTKKQYTEKLIIQ